MLTDPYLKWSNIKVIHHLQATSRPVSVTNQRSVAPASIPPKQGSHNSPNITTYLRMSYKCCVAAKCLHIFRYCLQVSFPILPPSPSCRKTFVVVGNLCAGDAAQGSSPSRRHFWKLTDSKLDEEIPGHRLRTGPTSGRTLCFRRRVPLEESCTNKMVRLRSSSSSLSNRLGTCPK